MAVTTPAAATTPVCTLDTRLLLGCVGKPSAGKSSLLNACTDANAKMGDYPFTTIEPNTGVAYYSLPCPCARYCARSSEDADSSAMLPLKRSYCSPRYGRCEGGVRQVPIKVLDVAGLVPGASEGKGLGNKFLNDLRAADVLLHVIDVSGTTDEQGRKTEGYDPSRDVEWLRGEVTEWVFANMWENWSNIVRRHVASRATAAVTLQRCWSGYGVRPALTQRILTAAGVREPSGLATWTEDDVRHLLDTFMEIRFPTVLVLNKIDMAHAESNIAKLYKRYDENSIVLSSALSEIFLRKMHKHQFIHYRPGDDDFVTSDADFDEDPAAETDERRALRATLKPLDERSRKRLKKLRDMVLYRFGGTGVLDAINRAVDQQHMIPVFPVENIHNFQSGQPKHVFHDCFLVRSGTTVSDVISKIDHSFVGRVEYAIDVNGKRLGIDTEITEKNNIFKLVLRKHDATTSVCESKS